MGYQPIPLESWKDCKALNNEYGQRISRGRAAGRLVGWMSAVVSPEITWAFEVVPIGGEWYGAIAADWQQEQVDLSQAAEDAGYSRELCAYARMSLGSMFSGRGPLGDFPKPDFVVGAKGGCNIQIKWYEAIARRYPVPFLVLDTPYSPDPEEYHLEYYLSQLYEYIAFLEEVTGTKTDEEKVVKSVTTAFRSSDVWDEIMELMKARPCPISMKSLYSYMPAIVNMAATPEALALLTKLRDELAQRVEEGAGDVQDESIRLLWEGMPLWYKLDFIKYFHENGASFIANGYLSGWGNIFRTFGDDVPTSFGTKIWTEPNSLREAVLEVAKRYVRGRGLSHRIQSTIRLAQEWEADGVIWHSNRGCKQVASGELDCRRSLQEETGLPTLLLEASMADSRDFSEAQMIARADAFLEQVRQRRRESKNVGKVQR